MAKGLLLGEGSSKTLKFKRLNVQDSRDDRKGLKTVYSEKRTYRIHRPFHDLSFLTLTILLGLFYDSRSVSVNFGKHEKRRK